jgi:hypothetical protein
MAGRQCSLTRQSLRLAGIAGLLWLVRLCSFAWDLPCILSRRHIRIAWERVIMIYWLRRAGAEKEGEEKEGHYCKSAFIKWLPEQPPWPLVFPLFQLAFESCRT